MNIPKETEQKIVELQMLEQNMQNFLMQKQKFQIGLSEIENAEEELKKLKEENAYKIIGDIMIKYKKDKLQEDLGERKKILDLRVKNLEKQEEKIRERYESLQKEVMKVIENGKSK